MPFATRLPKVGDRREYCNERTWMCYHQTPPLERVVAQVWDAGQAKPHLEHNPLSPLGVCHAIPIRKLNDPAPDATAKDKRSAHRLIIRSSVATLRGWQHSRGLGGRNPLD